MSKRLKINLIAAVFVLVAGANLSFAGPSKSTLQPFADCHSGSASCSCGVGNACHYGGGACECD